MSVLDILYETAKAAIDMTRTELHKQLTSLHGYLAAEVVALDRKIKDHGESGTWPLKRMRERLRGYVAAVDIVRTDVNGEST